MIEAIHGVINAISGFLYQPYIVPLFLIAAGLYFTVRTGFLQVRLFGESIKVVSEKPKDKRSVSSFGALMVSTASRVGTGNIIGVSTAICLGGFGAIFWMWIIAFFGMATKYAEGLLAVKYREVDAQGHISGGPMYYIKNGLGEKWKPLGTAFAIFGVLVAFFGIGTFAQVNSIVEITRITAGIPVEATAAVLTVLVAAVTLGGLQSISRVAEKIVPAMAVIYCITTIGVLAYFWEAIPAAVSLVLESAFTGTAATGGFLGATVMMAMQSGIARGLFSNESGLGSAPIVAAAAKTRWPAEQGLVSMTGTFIDTIIICTLTGLTIIVTGQWTADLNGAALTNAAFSTAYSSFGSGLLMVSLVLFAFTTILGWNYYGERCVEYLGGVKLIRPYRIIFILLVACGAFLKLEAIWVLADIVNGLMAIPNLIALIGLSGVVVSETKLYFDHLAEEKEEEEKARTLAAESGK